MSKADILEELPKLGVAERQEILERLCDLQEAALTDVHQKWVDEAIDSGPAQPGTPSDWDEALQRGLSRAAKQS